MTNQDGTPTDEELALERLVDEGVRVIDQADVAGLIADLESKAEALFGTTVEERRAAGDDLAIPQLLELLAHFHETQDANTLHMSEATWNMCLSVMMHYPDRLDNWAYQVRIHEDMDLGLIYQSGPIKGAVEGTPYPAP